VWRTDSFAGGVRGIVVSVDFSSPTVDATRGRLLARFGARVEPWWERLPAAIAELAERWELAVGDAVGRGNTSLVVRCRGADGRPAVLKLTPDAELAAAEAWALRSWAPSGHVPLVWGYDASLGALLLEAIPSETPLSELSIALELDEVANLIGSLHRNGEPILGNGVDSLAERVEFIFPYWIERHRRRGEAVTRLVPVERLRRGHELARKLAADAEVPVLLHGDMGPSNVLYGGAARGLVAIDPRPCVGEPAVDAVDWVFWGVNDPRAWEPRSRDRALTLGVEHERLWAGAPPSPRCWPPTRPLETRLRRRPTRSSRSRPDDRIPARYGTFADVYR
jgi:streptomycin 6-kinase